jgi:peptidyl-prolyl cis-trans isomerase SurA
MPLKYFYSCLILFLSYSTQAQKEPIVIDKIVAQVGDNVILLSDLQQQKLQMIQASLEVSKESDCKIIEDMMVQNLLLNQAKLDSIQISDAQVDAEMENRIRVIEQQIGGRDKLEAFYGKSVTQIKKEFREIIKDRLLTQEMERKIAVDVSVTPKDVDLFYKKIPTDSIPYINSQLSFQQIVHYPDVTKDDKLKTMKQLEEIRLYILGGKSFETQARIHSMDPGSAKDGGKIEATRGMMVPQFEATAFSLKEGDVSNVFETEYGYHIMKLIKRKGEDYICQHILLIPEYSTSELEKSASIMDTCFKMLRENKITWDDAVVRFSNDERTKQNHGIITNPISGNQSWSMEELNQVDQQIFVLTDALDKGEISQPGLYFDIYDRKQGIRLVRLMERTEPHVANLNQDYALVKRAAENAKKEQIVASWTKDKINKAYVRIDPQYTDCNYQYNWTNK